MRVVFMGTPDFAVPSLEALHAAGHEIAAVFTQPDRPKGRGYALVPPPVKVLAERLSIPVHQPATLKDGAAQRILEALTPDAVVVVAYGRILPEALLSIPRLGCVCAHASLLPKYRGAGPIQWAVLNGERETGITTMLMDKGIDTGDILLAERTPLLPDEAAGELEARLSQIAGPLLCETLTGLEDGSLRPRPQQGKATYAPMLKKELSPLDFSRQAEQLYNQVRGLQPWPVAHFSLDGKRVRVLRASVCAGVSGASPGAVLEAGSSLIVACGGGAAIELIKIQPEGGRVMSAAEYLRGHPIPLGAILSHALSPYQ